MSMITALAICASPFVGAWTQNNESLTFYQVDLTLGRKSQLNSDWGAVEVGYLGYNQRMYLNVAVNGTWQVRNMTLNSRMGVGVWQRHRFHFSLGNQPGQDVPVLQYGCTITPFEMQQQPSTTQIATVANAEYWVKAGEDGLTPLIPPASPFLGILPCITYKGHPPTFPNQESSENWCVPTAISNSLIFLNARHELGMNPALLTPAALAAALGNQTGKGADTTKWVERKRDYCNKNKLPIETTIVEPDDAALLGPMLEEGADIELSTGFHTAAVVGITERCSDPKKGEGVLKEYEIEVAHDTNQRDKSGGCITETVTMGPNSKNLTGSPSFKGQAVQKFVVEKPRK